MTGIPPPAVRLSDVGKRYTKYDDRPALVTGLLNLRERNRRSTLWAVRHVDLDVPRGQCLGVIGRNGSGKSTLLQMMCGVTSPTEGRVQVRGRVAPLISVGVGFHPELTGRENVFINGTILGMSRAEITAKFDSIVDFAELRDFIDTPVKFYSSGMYVRLGFAVAIHCEPDVLLLDEILAVGDLTFQLKCFDRMKQVVASGATVLLVSHNLNAVRRFCDRVLLLDHGSPRYVGDPAQAISELHRIAGDSRDPEGVQSEAGRHVGGVAVIDQASLVGADGRATAHFTGGETVGVRLRVSAMQDVEQPFVAVALENESGTLVYSESSVLRPMSALASGSVRDLDVRFRAMLPTGSYSITAAVHRREDVVGGTVRLAVSEPLTFYVDGRDLVFGAADLHAEFPSAD